MSNEYDLDRFVHFRSCIGSSGYREHLPENADEIFSQSCERHILDLVLRFCYCRLRLPYSMEGRESAAVVIRESEERTMTSSVKSQNSDSLPRQVMSSQFLRQRGECESRVSCTVYADEENGRFRLIRLSS